MLLGLHSLRGRIILLSVLLMLTLLAAALHIEKLADQALLRNEQLMGRHREVRTVLAELKQALNQAEGGLYQYAVLMDDSQRATVMQARDAAIQKIAALSQVAWQHQDAELGRLSAELQSALAALYLDAGTLLDIIADVDSRYPVSVLITSQLYPANMRFSAAMETALAEMELLPDTGPGLRIRELLQSLRYYWSQQIAFVRMYIANRSGVFGQPEAEMQRQRDNHQAYMDLVGITLKRLRALEAEHGVGFALDSALIDMESAHRLFQHHFVEVAQAYESDRWRADVPFFREQIQPGFARCWSLVNGLEQRLALMAAEAARQSSDAAGTVSYFVWLVTAMAGGFVMVTWLAYELLVRRPIRQVTTALRALGRGISFSPLLKTYASETDAMLQAFRETQGLVYAREMRLAAILDNAGEGIITINESGLIETFNSAAEKLFGFRSEDVLGRNITLLMPHPTREEHDGYLRRYLETGEQRVLGSEMNVNAQRKDGSLFPMSIKVTELVLEGRRYFTAIVTDISERKAMMDHLRQMAEHDSLTGLYNRQYFLAELERVTDRSQRQGGLDCALLYIDLDNFKFVNDTLGHLAGDRLLVEVATLLEKRARRGDIIARLGGDEFALLLFDVDGALARIVADDFRQLMAEYSFREDGRLIDIGCSIGVSLLSPDVKTKEDLMARADLSCHMAKRAGRNCVHVYQPDDRQSLEDMSTDMGWSRTIKHAIEHDRFEFALQPIVDVRTGHVFSREVLLRMLDEAGELIMPSGFLPSAERFGLILDIDRWVIEHAVDLLRRRGDPEERFTINLSAMSMADPGLLGHVTRVLAENHIEPSRITFEITETVAISDLAAAMELMERLRELGCRTALDDFGAGYSSFAYLKDLPVDYVKIDGSFVAGIDKDPLHRAMVKSMNEIAHAMGKPTVAEFVSNERILAMLCDIGVDYAQGYHTGHPEPAGYPALCAADSAEAAGLERRVR